MAACATVVAADEHRLSGRGAGTVAHRHPREAEPPAGVVDVWLDGRRERVWPFTADDFGDIVRDPLNLVFLGEVDPRNVRSILMGLDGNRTAFGFPDAFPFNIRHTLLGDPEQSKFQKLRVGQRDHFELDIDCGDN
jgi:hypothetical protein